MNIADPPTGHPLPPGGRDLDSDELDRLWDAWTPAEVAARLSGVSAPWCVVAGWALDLYLVGPSRHHADIEIAVPRNAFPEIAAALTGFEWDVAGGGRVWRYREAGDHPDLHQAWCREPATGLYRLDVFREPCDGNRWICRRDRSISLPYDELILSTPDGIPYVIPEVALLFKARHTRPKDQDDFRRVAPRLTTASRLRLIGWLRRVHPDHRWLTELRPAPLE